MPPEVVEALSYLVVAIIGWLVPSPRSMRGITDVKIHRETERVSEKGRES